jgi:hypothetical protein
VWLSPHKAQECTSKPTPATPPPPPTSCRSQSSPAHAHLPHIAALITRVLHIAAAGDDRVKQRLLGTANPAATAAAAVAPVAAGRSDVFVAEGEGGRGHRRGGVMGTLVAALRSGVGSDGQRSGSAAANEPHDPTMSPFAVLAGGGDNRAQGTSDRAAAATHTRSAAPLHALRAHPHSATGSEGRAPGSAGPTGGPGPWERVLAIVLLRAILSMAPVSSVSGTGQGQPTWTAAAAVAGQNGSSQAPGVGPGASTEVDPTATLPLAAVAGPALPAKTVAWLTSMAAYVLLLPLVADGHTPPERRLCPLKESLVALKVKLV